MATKKDKEAAVAANPEPVVSTPTATEPTPAPAQPAAPATEFKLTETTKANKNWNPLTSEPRAEKDYAKPFTNTAPPDPSRPVEDIPEPTFVPPKIDINSVPNKPPLAQTPINPDIGKISPGERQQSAEMLADTILMGYEKLHDVGAWYVSVSEDKLLQDAVEGKISLDLALPTNADGSETLTLQEFVTNFNKQAKEALRVHPDFNAKVRPILIRVLEKHGFGMSDEARLAILFGEDLVTKGAQVFGLKKTLNGVMKNFTDLYARQKKDGKGNYNSPNQGSSSGSGETMDAEIIHE